MRIIISSTIFNDLCVRCPEDETWQGIEAAGTYDISIEQAKKIQADCDYQGNVTGDYIDPVSPGLTSAYRALYKQIKRAQL